MTQTDYGAVHVVVRMVGDYERVETLIAAFLSQDDAGAFIAKANEEWKLAIKAVPDTLDYPENDAPEEEWNRWERRRKRAWAKFRKMLTLDPDTAPEGAWMSPDEPTYYATAVPLRTPPASPEDTPRWRENGTVKRATGTRSLSPTPSSPSKTTPPSHHGINPPAPGTR